MPCSILPFSPKEIRFLLLFIGCFSFSSCKENNLTATEATIIFWYGEEQKFGFIGHPQEQVNILGNIQSTDSLLEAQYTLNGLEKRHSLTLGPDLHRLAAKGDFNIEIYRNQLRKGRNRIRLLLHKNDTLLKTKEVIINYQPDTNWPLPYEIDWNKVKNIQDAVQVVDGQWELTPDGIRTKDVYYDRVIAFGDASWRNYEVTTTVTFHGYNSPREGPPTYNVSHAAIASRWPGHDQDSLQPNRKWFPLGATSEFRITDGYANGRWRIFDGENFYEEQPASDYRTLVEGKVYAMKHRVEDLSATETKYSVKPWEADTVEPKTWDFSAVEVSEQPPLGGSCLLLAHHTDVTFGNIYVKPVGDAE